MKVHRLKIKLKQKKKKKEKKDEIRQNSLLIYIRNNPISPNFSLEG